MNITESFLANSGVQDLVTRIGELLFDLPAPDNDDHPIHWGHVGDLSEINSRLSAVIAFMTGTEK